jgi:hypothetical protein
MSEQQTKNFVGDIDDDSSIAFCCPCAHHEKSCNISIESEEGNSPS